MIDQQPLRTDRQLEAASLRLQRKFGKRGSYRLSNTRSYHSVFVKKTVAPSLICEAFGCMKPATHRIGFNCWGSLQELDVCEDHRDNDGKSGDGI